jgi:putative acetyltransferase
MVPMGTGPQEGRGSEHVRGLAARCGTFGCVQVTIRAYEPRDAAGVADVFYRSVREVARSDYTDDQVKAWVPGPLNVEQGHLRSSDGRLVLVAAEEQDRVVAFIDLEPDGHIDRLYCAPEAAGRGIASRLYDGLEAAAREEGVGRRPSYRRYVSGPGTASGTGISLSWTRLPGRPVLSAGMAADGTPMAQTG